MSGFYRSMEYISSKMNAAKDTKQSIITAANSYEYITSKIREIEENAMKEIKSEKTEEIYFDPNEIEPIVLKNREDKIDGFKEKLKVNQQKQMEDKEKIVQIEQKNRKTEERETR